MEEDNTKKIIYINSCNLCGRKLKIEWKCCPFCKAPVDTFSCSLCGKTIRSNWNYCPHCSSEIKVEQKNKQRIDKCNDWLRSILKND